MSEAQDGPLAAGAADAADSAVRNESVSMALLVVLETLSPLERAVFVLREVFGYSHAEIGEILGRSSSAIRQLAHRAREHVQARRPRFQADPEVRQRVTERFLSAALGGDLAGLMNLLAPDVTLWTDGGGKAPAAMRPVLGRDKVARTLHAYAGNSKQPNLEFHYWHVNGDPSAVVFSGDSPYAVMIVDVNRDSGQVTDVYLVTNPDKLQGVRLDKAGAAGGAPGREPSAPGTGPTRGGHRRAGTDPGAAG
jgi:RNA polymerase sigma-70 factor (ECF subfamily)